MCCARWKSLTVTEWGGLSEGSSEVWGWDGPRWPSCVISLTSVTRPAFCISLFILHQGTAHFLSKPIFVQPVNIHSWWKVPLRNASHRLGTNELTVELPGQQAPRSLIDEPRPQLKHQEVAGGAYTLKTNPCSSTNLPTAAAHLEHSKLLVVLGANANLPE